MDNQRSNPFSTGGGGVTFEQQVGAYYLVSLLASDIPRGLNNGICHSVAFQRRWDGALLDDIVITSRSANGTERHLMLQAKHEITVSAARTNDLFRQVIRDSWTAFQRSEFDTDKDRLGLAVCVYDKTVDNHLQRLLDWARTSISVEEFRRVKIENFSSFGLPSGQVPVWGDRACLTAIALSRFPLL